MSFLWSQCRSQHRSNCTFKGRLLFVSRLSIGEITVEGERNAALGQLRQSETGCNLSFYDCKQTASEHLNGEVVQSTFTQLYKDLIVLIPPAPSIHLRGCPTAAGWGARPERRTDTCSVQQAPAKAPAFFQLVVWIGGLVAKNGFPIYPLQEPEFNP